MHEVQVSWAAERALGNDNGYESSGIPGTWGSWSMCDTMQWAHQYRLKISPDQGASDDVALTSVELQCSDRSGSAFSTVSTAHGDVLAIGFRIRAEVIVVTEAVLPTLESLGPCSRIAGAAWHCRSSCSRRPSCFLKHPLSDSSAP